MIFTLLTPLGPPQASTLAAPSLSRVTSALFLAIYVLSWPILSLPLFPLSVNPSLHFFLFLCLYLIFTQRIVLIPKSPILPECLFSALLISFSIHYLTDTIFSETVLYSSHWTMHLQSGILAKTLVSAVKITLWKRDFKIMTIVVMNDHNLLIIFFIQSTFLEFEFHILKIDSLALSIEVKLDFLNVSSYLNVLICSVRQIASEVTPFFCPHLQFVPAQRTSWALCLTWTSSTAPWRSSTRTVKS